MALDPIDINKEIQSYIDEFIESVGPIEKSIWVKVSMALKELSVNAFGEIKKIASNLKIIKQIQKIIDSVTGSSNYQIIVAKLNGALQKILKTQTEYFSVMTEKIPAAFITETQAQYFDLILSQLTEAGIAGNISLKAAAIMRTGIMEGLDYSTLYIQLKDFMIGATGEKGKMVSYSGQIVNDALHGASRAYNAKMVEDLNLDWYQFVGSLSKNSRPICPVLVRKQWIHKSEIAGICRGIVDGRKVSTEGMIPGTNSENWVNRCNGYNCNHSGMPVSSLVVPRHLRLKFENEPAN